MNAIVVIDKNWAIGRNNTLLFSLPTDMRRFRSLTLDGTVILGRKTLDSFPGGKPLPRRRNIVLTRNPDFSRTGVEIAHNPEQIRELVKDIPSEQLWFIGGGEIYKRFLSDCIRAYITKVDTAASNPDAFFPNLDQDPDWAITHSSPTICENGLHFRFVIYENQRFLRSRRSNSSKLRIYTSQKPCNSG